MLGDPGRDYPAPGTVLDLIATCLSDPYLSWVEDVRGEEIVVSVPRDPSLRPVSVPVGEQIDVVWNNAGDLRCLPMALTSVVPGEGPRWCLRRVAAVKRGQRRGAVRVALTLPVVLVAERTTLRATTIDLSESGLRCVLEKERHTVLAASEADAPRTPPEVGDVVRVAAVLPDTEIRCLAEVTRRHPRDDPRIELSVRFIGLPEHQQDLIRTRVFTRLRELRRRGLL